MASAVKILGMLLQVAGMLVMLFGFVTLVLGIQEVMKGTMQGVRADAGLQAGANASLPAVAAQPACDFETDAFCAATSGFEGQVSGVVREFAGIGSVEECGSSGECAVQSSEEAFTGRVARFIIFLVVGIALMMLGLLLRALEETAGFFGGLERKNGIGEKDIVGRRKFGKD